MLTRLIRTWWLFLLVIAVVACGRPESSEVEPVVRDSAGIVIVENRSQPPTGAQYRISDRPIVQFGAMDGDGSDVFGAVQHAFRQRSGEIVVADAIAREIRVFSADAEHLLTFGRQGQGPGEFANLWWMAPLTEDSIVAVDNIGGRASVFTSNGEFARSFALPRATGAAAPNVVGLLDDGALVVSALTSAASRDERSRSTVIIYTVDLQGQISNIIGEYLHHELGRNGLGLGFGGESVVATADSIVWYSHTSRFDLRGFDRAGSLRRIVRVDRSPSPVSSDDIARARAAVEESLARQGATGAVARRILETEFASTHPVHGRLLVDQLGHVWVEEGHSTLLDVAGPQERIERWDVVDAAGWFIASVVMPRGLRVTQIGEDFVLGVYTDDLGVHRIRMYGLERNA